MYNSITGALYGISKNCWNLYGIPKTLVYGNGDGEHSIVIKNKFFNYKKNRNY